MSSIILESLTSAAIDPWWKLGRHLIESVNGLLLLFVLFVPLERIFLLKPGKVLRAQFFVDVAFFFCNRAVATFLLAVPFGLLAWGISLLPLGELHRAVGSWPLWVKIFAGLLVGEAGAYWAHRFLHEIPALWRFHAIHHAAEEMDWLVNVRVHPVEVVFMRMFQFIPLFALGLIQPSRPDTGLLILLIPLIGAIWGYFIHANVRWRFGFLEWLVTTPAFHHWHHTNDRPDLHNRNYASILPLFDLLFGSFHLPKGERTKSFGITEAMPKDFWGMLWHPLSRKTRVRHTVRTSEQNPFRLPSSQEGAGDD